MSELREVVCDTGPLISLEKLTGGYAFIRQLYDRLIVPPAVLDEAARGQHGSPQAYLDAYQIGGLLRVQVPSSSTEVPDAHRLHTGEQQAIQLALELDLPLLIEEIEGRRVAQAAGCTISGIAGQILKAFRQEIVDSATAKAMFDEMADTGRINKRLHRALIEAIGYGA